MQHFFKAVTWVNIVLKTYPCLRFFFVNYLRLTYIIRKLGHGVLTHLPLYQVRVNCGEHARSAWRPQGSLPRAGALRGTPPPGAGPPTARSTTPASTATTPSRATIVTRSTPAGTSTPCLPRASSATSRGPRPRPRPCRPRPRAPVAKQCAL